MPYSAAIARLEMSALFDLKGPRVAFAAWTRALPPFPDAPNTLSRSEGATLSFIGPEHWILRASRDREPALEAALRPGEAGPEISIVRISDTLTFFRITGADAGEVMSIGCPLDLHPAAFVPDAVSFTEFFGLKALVMRCAGGFDCAVEASFGDMVADYLARALA